MLWPACRGCPLTDEHVPLPFVELLRRAMASHGANVFFGGDFFHINGHPARVGKVNGGGGAVSPLQAMAHGQHAPHGGKILALAFVRGQDTFLYAGGSFEEQAVRWKLVEDGGTRASPDSDQRWQYQGLQATPGPVRAIIPAFRP